MKITSERALQRILALKGKGTGAFRVAKKPPTLSKTMRNKLYVFDNYGKTIVVPNRDDLPPILAEYDSGKTPPELTWWLNEYADEMAAAVDGGVMTKAPAKAPVINIEHLLGDIKWGQRSPWWNKLIFPHPTKEGSRCYCVTGCAPTAVAMVLYYFAKQGKRRGCLATKAYTTIRYKYSVAAKASVELFDWASMTDGKPTTAKGKNAVATLMEYCGKALQADYGYNSTSTPMARVAPTLKEYFGMGDARRLQNLSNAALKAAIIEELKLAHPVIMCGSGNNECHCFVCDGYRSSDDMFHFNWGYEGDGDGWFKLTALNPSTHDFSSGKNAIVGLTPYLLGDTNGDGRINISDVTNVINEMNSGAYDRQMDVNSDGKVDKQDTQQIIDTILGKKQ